MICYGPWIIKNVLYRKRETTIYSTYDNEWIIKVIDHDTYPMDEIAIVLTIWNAQTPSIRHCVELPPTLYSLYGRTAMSGWYAMRRYDGHVTNGSYCRYRWRLLAVHVLRFLHDYHYTIGRIHMDIKKQNIFVICDTDTFVVADYEHSDVPSATLTRDYDQNYCWYYMAMGAELDQPLKSWRLDFVSLAIVLGSLHVHPTSWTFEVECWNKRDSTNPQLSDVDVISLREKELTSSKMNYIIKTYLTIINDIPWSSVTPPPHELYTRLEELFLSTL